MEVKSRFFHLAVERAVQFLRVEFFVEPVDVAQSFREHDGHVFVEVLVVLLHFDEPHLDKLVDRPLIDVRVQPGQVKPIDAESD